MAQVLKRFQTGLPSNRGRPDLDQSTRPTAHAGKQTAPKGAVPAIKRSFTAERGAAVCIAACLDQIEAGREQTLTTDALEGPHQLRIGLRRLRTALGLFRGAIDGPNSRTMAEQAKWLGQEVGKTRDLEVVLREIFEPALGTGKGPAHAFLQSVRAAQQAERNRLRKLLGGRRVRQFLADLQDYSTHRGWLLPDDIWQTERLAKPVADQTGQALSRRWKKTMKKARHLQDLSVTESHELRKSLKKLRYSTEFLQPLYSARRALPFLKRLKALQEVYGSWNDAAIAKRVFETQIGPATGGQGDLGPIADVIDKLRDQAADSMARAQGHWHKLDALRKPWARH